MKLSLFLMMAVIVLWFVSCTETKIVYVEKEADTVATDSPLSEADDLETEVDGLEDDTDLLIMDEAQDVEEGDQDGLNDDDALLVECTAVTIEELYIYGEGDSIEYDGLLVQQLGSADLIDPLMFWFYPSGEEVSRSELTVGSYDLGAEVNTKITTCTECVFILQDYDEETGGGTTAYFQESGTLEVTEVKAGTPEAKGTITAKLVQVYIDMITQEAIPVPGGACLEFKAAVWDTICVPECGEKVCGGDGCGGFCGAGCNEEGTQCNADGTACIPCTAITLQEIVANVDLAGEYQAALTANIAGEDTADMFYIDLLGAQEVGIFDLGTGDNAAYDTCKQCVKMYADTETEWKSYFQQSGTLEITDLVTDVYGSMTAESTGHIDGVRLVELTIDEETSLSIPLKDGACFEITSASWDTMPAY